MKKKLLFTTVLSLFLCISFVLADGITESSNEFFKNLQLGNILTEQNSPGTTENRLSNVAVSAGKTKIEQNMSTLTRLYQLVEKNYLYDIDHEAVYEAMASAMFEALGDQYSEFITKDKTETFQEQTEGIFGGLGIVFTKPEEYCLIEQVYANTPASQAGLTAKDIITHIDGEQVDDLTNQECADRMRGEVGQSVVLTILRNKTSFDVEIVRDIISIPALEYTMLDNGIAYIYISSFYPSTATEFAEIAGKLKEQGMTDLIIDLRDCPGGDVDSCLCIADMFISDAKLLTVSYKDSSKNTVFWANKSVYIDPSVDVAILVNGGTASSAEIFSSTMRDNNRAILIGSTTFGKGIMQIVSSFGNAQYKLTAASYTPPSGEEIHKIGITPDIEVEDTTVADEDVDAYLELYNSDLIELFVNEHPEFTVENVNLFVDTHPEINLKPLIIKLLVRNEYYVRMDYEARPKADVLFDPAIIKAMEILNN